jgi:hypothetical protein
MVAFSLAAFFSSMTAIGRPFRNTTTSGRGCGRPPDGELVDHEPVVVLEHVEVDDAHRVVADGAVGAQVLHADAVHEVVVQLVVRVDRLGRRDARELAERLVEAFARNRGIQPRERVAQAAVEHDVRVGPPLLARLAGRDRGASRDRVPERLEPREGRLLDDGFGEGGHGFRSRRQHRHLRLPETGDQILHLHDVG